MTFIRANRSTRLKRFLEAGFYPRDMPPPFVSSDFARFRNFFRSNWPAIDLKKFASDPEYYSIPKFGRARRRFSIVNPINQFKVADLISSEWKEIRSYLKNSKVSEFRPVFDTTGSRAFFQIDFSLIERRLARLLAENRSVLKTDISRYYHTIYTHSIPWALYGKSYCKANYTLPIFKTKLGDRLDKAVRQCQSNQTMGIPVGPDTSRILGEIIGVGIEKELAASIPRFENRALRYVDDIQIGFDDRESVDGLLGNVTKAFSNFELDINIEKTAVLGVGESVSPDWAAELRRYRLSGRQRNQQSDLESYFRAAIYFSQENPRDQVLAYAIKRSRSFRILDESFEYYVSLLLQISRRDTSCLPAVVQILAEANYRKRPLDRDLIKKFIVDVIRYNAPIHYYFEVSWALFLSKALKINLDRVSLKDVFSAESSVCALLVLDLNSRGQIIGGIDTGYWQSLYSADALKSNMWLLVYEATLKGWLPAAAPCFVSNDALFGPMLAKKVSFYDVNRNVPSTRKDLRTTSWQMFLSKIIFQNIERYF